MGHLGKIIRKKIWVCIFVWRARPEWQRRPQPPRRWGCPRRSWVCVCGGSGAYGRNDRKASCLDKIGFWIRPLHHFSNSLWWSDTVTKWSAADLHLWIISHPLTAWPPHRIAFIIDICPFILGLFSRDSLSYLYTVRNRNTRYNRGL